MKKTVQSSVLIFSLLLLSFTGEAQKKKTTRLNSDTSKPETVVITSAYKPVLKVSPKINFSASVPAAEVNGEKNFRYNVPSQNLFFNYEPLPLQPLALETDADEVWTNTAWVKAGFGSQTTPCLDAMGSVGNGSTQYLNGRVKYISSKGSVAHQQYSNVLAEVNGMHLTPTHHEWLGKLYFKNDTYHQYGYEPKTLTPNRDSLKNRFTRVGLEAAFKNRVKTEFGIFYSPKIAVEYLTDNRDANELNLRLTAPFTKVFTDELSLRLQIDADITNYKSNAVSVNNNLFQFAPSVQYQKNGLKINAGITPSWDNSEFKLLPNVEAEATVGGLPFALMAGWKGVYEKNTYSRLSGVNPYLYQPLAFANTRKNELYAGLKGAAGNHINYLAKVSFIRAYYAPLFVNDTLTQKGFETLYEPSMNIFRLHGELSYTFQEKISLHSALTLSQYGSQEVYDRAWHYLPIEVNAGVRWKVLKDLLVKSDFHFFEGPQYRIKTAVNTFESAKQRAGIDLSLGAEFSIMPKLDVWVQMNNILNSRYERWNHYEVLGFQVLGGIIYRFK